MERGLKISLCGCSGMGKTTIAKELSDIMGIPFISSSYSDLVPSTKLELHKDMITKDSNDIYNQDYQLLNLRRNQLKGVDTYVSDRSFIDNATYFVHKLSHLIPECETLAFLDLCKTLLPEFTTHIIIIPYTWDMIDKWVIEDNHKRVTNRVFQMEIFSVMDTVTKILLDTLVKTYSIHIGGTENQIFQDINTGIKVLYLNNIDREERISVIKCFLGIGL